MTAVHQNSDWLSANYFFNIYTEQAAQRLPVTARPGFTELLVQVSKQTKATAKSSKQLTHCSPWQGFPAESWHWDCQVRRKQLKGTGLLPQTLNKQTIRQDLTEVNEVMKGQGQRSKSCLGHWEQSSNHKVSARQKKTTACSWAGKDVTFLPSIWDEATEGSRTANLKTKDFSSVEAAASPYRTWTLSPWR